MTEDALLGALIGYILAIPFAVAIGVLTGLYIRRHR